jgi:LPS-assembly lipoprotein
VFVLALVLGGCGFQLRGTIDLPPDWEDLHLRTASTNSELARALRDGAARAGIRWQDLSDANYIVFLGNEEFRRRNLTIATNARAAEFELEMSTNMRVTDREGNELLPETVVRSTQIITNDPENIAGKAEEARLLRDEMRQLLVQELLRKLRFLAENSGAATSRAASSRAASSRAASSGAASS